MRLLVCIFFNMFVWLPFAASAEDGEPLRMGDMGPDFSLQDTRGQLQTLSSYRGKVVVLEWVNMACPAVRKHYSSGNMQKNQLWAADHNVVWFSVSAPLDEGLKSPSTGSLDTALSEFKTGAYTTVMDIDGEVTRAYNVHRTPEFVILDAEGKIMYRGAADDKPGDQKADISEAEDYVRNAMKSLSDGKIPEPNKTSAYGCPLSKPKDENERQWML